MKLILTALVLFTTFCVTACDPVVKNDDDDKTTTAPMPDTATAAMGADTTQTDYKLVDSLNR
ncbi:MAG: hypothetical protein ABI390_08360 [Daejeonella sp.]